MLNWCQPFSICCLFDSQQYHSPYSSEEWLMGVSSDNRHSYPLHAISCFQELYELHQQHNDWLLGHFNFEANHLPGATHRVNFPQAHFFIPDILLQIKDNTLTIGCLQEDPAVIYEQILRSAAASIPAEQLQHLEIQQLQTREEFIQALHTVQRAIQRGDCYELNYCTAFFAENIRINPFRLFADLSTVAPNPFAAFYRYFDQYLVSASPERFLQKKGALLRSQPIKGTSRRILTDPTQDEAQKNYLLESSKEKAENIMVVDLVRNDLSQVCLPGTVKVTELLGLYSFPQVHQLISTITGELSPRYHWGNALQACYPMGSMTGAPKKRVLELIAATESAPRGIFSGSVGYITPSADFDFNVVIRSVLYNAQEQYACFPAGAGITIYSDPEQEYEECLLKVAAIKKVLTHGVNT